MALKNMKMKPRVVKETLATAPDVDRPVYPWGLRLTLDEDTLEKLKLDLPEVGAVKLVIGRAEVVSVSDNRHDGDDGPHRHRHVELQITELDVAEPPKGKLEDSLYGDT